MSGPLDEARGDAEARVASLEAQLANIVETASASSGDDEHDPEGQTIAYDRAQVAALLAAARHDVAEIDAARARVDAGTYGVCERCGRPIAAERLEARPAARTCVTCA
ncbi:TraR/DksA family transcriptional regulator [Actinomycetospora succinea]|uniref:TraR/DksA family transcriptional regulator n=1 Tax=Actinomycetospora succinea TaxID=663603 RepID=A0A4R6V263_9PSEU|nr:TraR/DksA C4-type zinc finger protein [Actinomycetospora succinea]TDQ52750.1 TraR/DksA family transcriptional regulator [Actinomycetospora succinea]